DGANGNLTLDFGFFEPLTLGNLVWHDVNNNGQRDSGEAGIDGVRIELYLDSNGNNQVDAGEFVASTTTASGGLYTFSDLIEGNYIVRIPASQFGAGQPLAGFVSSTGTNGSATGAYEPAPDTNNDIDNDDNGTTGGSGNVDSAPVTLARSTEPTTDGDGDNGNLTVDFGFFRHARLGDRVWHDLDADGIQDTDESGIGGVSVQLFSAGPDNAIGGGDDALVATTGTDGSGVYGFSHLLPGNYYLIFAQPTGYSYVSPQDQGSDNAADSDVDPVTRQTLLITLAAGDNDPSWDMGVFNRASIGNFVWEDTDGDGVQDSGENGIGGVTVTLYRADDSAVGSTTTAADGSYSFSNLPPGAYYLVFSNLPSGYVFTAADQGGDNEVDSDADTVTGRTSTFTLVSGQIDLSWDAGLYRPASVGDRVWLDTNGNGLQDTGESGIQSVAVAIYSAGPDGVIGGGDDVFVEATSTDSSGNYSFSGLRPGSYYLLFDLPSGYSISPQDRGSDNTIDSDVNPISRQTAVITLASGDNDPTWDMGVFNRASIGNFVWEDTDGDGVQDSGENGI
ncbi:MAG: SdrD B-like domain-containing protein, partial [Chloroflexus sp.]|uniref:SdrD B-like domain-containing protein n=1 Tax=Chloroflexus sp. TaxID=1904827 RepID=UPI00404A227F